MIGTSKVKRSYYCNLHTSQKIESVCSVKNCQRPLLCIECIADGDIHNVNHKEIMPIDEFCDKIDTLRMKNSNIDKRSILPKEYEEIIISKDKNLEQFRKYILKEKQLVEKAMNDIIVDFTIICHDLKEKAYN